MPFYSLGASVQPYNIGDRYIAPWQNYNATPLQAGAYLNDPSMAQGAYMNAVSQSGPGAISGDMYKWLNNQMGDYWQKFKGWQANIDPAQFNAGQHGWDSYMKQQDPFQDYMNTNPYAGIGALSRPTRFNLRR